MSAAVTASSSPFMYPLPKWPQRENYVNPLPGGWQKFDAIDLNALVEQVLVEHGKLIYETCHADVFRLLQPANRHTRGISWALGEFRQAHYLAHKTGEDAKVTAYYETLEELRQRALQSPVLRYLGDALFTLQAIKAENGMDYELRRRLMDVIALVDRTERQANEALITAYPENGDPEFGRKAGSGSRAQRDAERKARQDARATAGPAKGSSDKTPVGTMGRQGQRSAAKKSGGRQAVKK